MWNGYHILGKDKFNAVFDLFYRPQPGLELAVAAGLEQACEYINNLHFGEEEINYLKSLNVFDDGFLASLKDFKFSGDIYAVREGEIVFPYEPLLTVVAPLGEAQFVETALLTIINHQTLIATKAMRITQESHGGVAEFGLRRAQGPDAGIYGARAAVIGGCVSTSNVLAAKSFNLKPTGTMAHSWIMSFETELEAFRKYADIYPANTLLLVDTYDTLKSGIPNAITVFKELRAKGYTPVGIRLDSGDLAYLSKKARDMLDKAGFENAKIFGGGDIDEEILMSLHAQDAKIDVWGIGTKLITSFSIPSLGGVYKMAGIYDENGLLTPKIKLSDTQIKITNPGLKKTYRIYDKDGFAYADVIALENEKFNTEKPLTLTHPTERWKTATIAGYTMRSLQVQVFKNGVQVYRNPSVQEISAYHKARKGEFQDEYKRLINPHEYKVDLSDKLYALKQKLITR
jgi:nicotinate phosphoribosyltransferase